ncbi:hypothetical protein CR513_05074, partial [Mucuna pruriens]
MKIDAALGIRRVLSLFLTENRDVFAWTLANMLRIDPYFLCYRLSIAPRTRSKLLGEKKQKAAKKETKKLLVARFIRELQYPTLLVNVFVVKKPSGK